MTLVELANLVHLRRACDQIDREYAGQLDVAALAKAALLRRVELSVTEVCLAVGCSSLGSFSARFTELVGETPTAYRGRGRDHSALERLPGCIARDVARPIRNPSRIEETPSVLAG